MSKITERIINRYVKIRKLLEYEGISVYSSKISCPFHNDLHPSAYIYEDETGDTIYCFSEAKVYYPYDLAVLYHIDVDALYVRIVDEKGLELPEVKPRRDKYLENIPSLAGHEIHAWFRGIKKLVELMDARRGIQG